MARKKKELKNKKTPPKKVIKKKLSGKNKTHDQRKFHCPGVNWHPSSGKWLAMFRHEGKGYFCAYAESEKDAITKRDQKLLEKLVGPTAETFFPKKNYDVKKAAKVFRAYKIELGIENSKKASLELTLKLGKGKLFREKKIEKRKIKGKTSHYVYVLCNNIKTCIGHASTLKQCEKLWDVFLKKQASKYINDYRNLRTETICRFKETPCDATYQLMLFSHGACSWQSVLSCSDLPKEKLAKLAKKYDL